MVDQRRSLLCYCVMLIIGVSVFANCRSKSPSDNREQNVEELQLSSPLELTFWHRQTGHSEELQQEIINEFMAANPNIKIKAEFVGDYGKLYQKTLAAIQAGSPPDLVATLETQASEYYDAGALIPFDNYITSQRYGLSDAELKDFVPSFLAAARFSQYDGKMLTFPYTKSVLLMYANRDVLRSLGIDRPALSWDDFLEHCRKAVAGGYQGYAFTGDASTFDAFVYSFGGELVSPDGKRPVLDDAATTQTLQMFETLGKEKLGYRITGDDDVNELLAGRALYIIKSSIMIRRLAPGFNDNQKWQVSIIPQASPDRKSTVLFGANFAILKSTAEKQLAAWLFVKYFTRSDITARWGFDPANGYFPVRQSALSHPLAQSILDNNPQFREALTLSPYARPEPSLRGWQEIRSAIEDSVTAVVTQKLTAPQAQQQLVEQARKVLGN